MKFKLRTIRAAYLEWFEALYKRKGAIKECNEKWKNYQNILKKCGYSSDDQWKEEKKATKENFITETIEDNFPNTDY